METITATPLPVPSDLVASPEQVRLSALVFMAKEFNVTGADKIVMFSKGLASFPDLQSALPSYNSSKFNRTTGEVSDRVDRVAHVYAYHKEAHNFDLSAVAFNRLLASGNFLESIQGSADRPFVSITEQGLMYGENVAPNPKSTQTRPHWYDDSIQALYTLVARL